MRLGFNLRNKAKNELLELLQQHGALRTSELCGTPKFHGHHTLSLRQVRSLLHELRRDGKIEYRAAGEGMRTYFVWSLKSKRR